MNCGIYLTGRSADPLVRRTLVTLLAPESKCSFTFVPATSVVTKRDSAGVDETATILLHDGDALALPLKEPPPVSTCVDTHVVALGKHGAMVVPRLVRASKCFHYVRVSGINEFGTSSNGELVEREPRDISGGLPGGLVVFGTNACPHTLAAAELLVEKALPFYYVNVTGQMGHYIDQLGPQRLDVAYRFAGKFPRNGSHSTVPIIFLDGKLVGGRTELTEAINDSSTRETLEEEVVAFAARVAYFETPARPESVLRAVEHGQIVRVVNLTR